ncbi:MAG: YchJ family metal-binding protein, partial [Gammaproteobacteria bacterium]
MTNEACPCGSGRALTACCGPYLDDCATAPTAEALMRSRYTAYVLERHDYLRATWDPATCPARLAAEPGLRWLGLAIKRVAGGGANDTTGTVEFVARSKRGGRASRLHEVSHFERRNGRWV